MGCLKLTYREELPTLRVVKSFSFSEEKSSTGVYRYGFQGQEKDDEIKGKGNSVNYKYRMHDPRLGRFFAVDPLHSQYAHNSPYAFSENRVIDGVELEGLEYKPYKKPRKTGSNFSGVGFFGRLLGKTAKGKYQHNNVWRGKGQTPEPGDEPNISPKKDPTVQPKLKVSKVKTITIIKIKEPPLIKDKDGGFNENFDNTYELAGGKEHKVKFNPYQVADKITIYDASTNKVIKATDFSNEKFEIVIPKEITSIRIVVTANKPLWTERSIVLTKKNEILS